MHTPKCTCTPLTCVRLCLQLQPRTREPKLRWQLHPRSSFRKLRRSRRRTADSARRTGATRDLCSPCSSSSRRLSALDLRSCKHRGSSSLGTRMLRWQRCWAEGTLREDSATALAGRWSPSCRRWTRPHRIRCHCSAMAPRPPKVPVLHRKPAQGVGALALSSHL